MQSLLSMVPPEGLCVKCREAGMTLLRKVFFRPLMQNTVKEKELTNWAGKVVQQLRALAIVAEDLGSNLSAIRLTNICNSNPRTSETLF